MNIKTIENSFALINPYSTKFASLFYQNLLSYPEMKSLLYNADMKELEKKMMISLIIIINSLKELSSFKKTIKEMVDKNKMYYVLLKSHKIIGDALLKTLEHHMGTNWTMEVKQAWSDVYNASIELILDRKIEDNILWWKDGNTKDTIPTVKKLRVEAIARKALREGYYPSLVIQTLLEDPYLKEINRKIGDENTLKIVTDIVESANQKELNTLAFN